MDLVSSDVLHEVGDAVSAINPTLRVHRTERAQIGLDELFNLRAYNAPPPTSTLECTACEEGHSHAEHAHGTHAHGITTTSIPLPTLSAAQFAALNNFLEEFIWGGALPRRPDESDEEWEGEQPEILRTKGYLRLEDGERVVQGVADLFEIRDVTSNQNTGEVQPKLVFIGRRVDARLGDVVRAHLGIS